MSRPPRNLVAMTLSAVTGFGHFYLERWVTGALLFGLFATALNGVFLGSTLQSTASPEALRGASLVALAVVWTFGMWHTYRLSYGVDRPALEAARAALLREGLVDYLRDDLEDARRKLERAVSLDVDWTDPDPLFHLGVVSLRLAERHAARRDARGARRLYRAARAAFRRSLARDPSRKWRGEVALELRRAPQATVTGRLRRAGASVAGAAWRAGRAWIPALRGRDELPSGPSPLDVARRSPVETRKHRRFSSKYKALTPSDLRRETRADLRAVDLDAVDRGPAVDLDAPTRHDLRPVGLEAAPAGDAAGVEGAAAAPARPASESTRLAGRFRRAAVTEALARDEGPAGGAPPELDEGTSAPPGGPGAGPGPTPGERPDGEAGAGPGGPPAGEGTPADRDASAAPGDAPPAAGPPGADDAAALAGAGPSEEHEPERGGVAAPGSSHGA